MKNIITERLIIRELAKKDIEALVKNANNLNVTKNLSIVPYPYKRKNAVEFINYAKKESKKSPRKNYELAIELKSEKQLIGVIGLTKVDKFEKKAGFGYWLGEKYWKQGYITEALIALIEFAFKKLKLNRLDIEAYVDNVGSNRVIEKVGFKYEGLRRKFIRSKADRKFHDCKTYGMLKDDWLIMSKKRQK